MPPKVSIFAMTSINAALTGPWLDQGLYYEIGAMLSADAVMIGSDSAVAGLKDFEPSLFKEVPVGVKETDENLPWLIIVDSKGLLEGKLSGYRQMGYIRDIIVLISDSTPGSYVEYLHRYDYRSLVSGDVSVDLQSGVELLGKSFGVKHIRVDSAGRLAGAFLALKEADELHLILSPFVSSSCALPAFTGPIEDIRLRLISTRKIKGGNVLLKYAICN